MIFNLYGSMTYRSVTVNDLIKLRAEIIARAENSGCEGVFVEVARWSDKQQRWARFAFAKCLGGELDHGKDCVERDAMQTARALCEEINGVEREIAPLIHTFKNWEG